MKLTYTRLEDNLIRHRGDRRFSNKALQPPTLPHIYLPLNLGAKQSFQEELYQKRQKRKLDERICAQGSKRSNTIYLPLVRDRGARWRKKTPLGGGRGAGAYSLVACFSHLTFDHAFPWRRSRLPVTHCVRRTYPKNRVGRGSTSC